VSYLRLQGVEKRFGSVEVIKGVDITAEQGEFVVFVGPSGCGKSTLLRMVAGLEEVSAGDIFLDGVKVTDLEPARRQVSMVFQSYALFPHMNVYDNIAFGLKMNRTPKPEIAARVAEAARILQLEPLLRRRPRELSGGQRQRVAIGRAIVRHPKLFLFDEPLSNLDAELRAQMRAEISRLHGALGVTMIYVTHDQVEAMTLADRIVVLRAGRIEQIGTPQELYDRPANTFVAGFIGSPRMNFLGVRAVGGDGAARMLFHPGFPAPVVMPREVPDGEFLLGIRPEQLLFEDGPCRIRLTADLCENLGGATLIYGQTANGETLALHTQGRRMVKKGEAFSAGFDVARAYLFAPDGRAL
jgi:lactose/L-arabinose transport system ATP-binding protein